MYWSAPPPVADRMKSATELDQLVIFALPIRSLRLDFSAWISAWRAVFRCAPLPMVMLFVWTRKALPSTESIGTRLPAMPSNRASSV